jgi:hypothetical protein
MKPNAFYYYGAYVYGCVVAGTLEKMSNRGSTGTFVITGYNGC